MKDSQILSAFQELAPQRPQSSTGILVFDACRVGLVLRAVMFVELVLMVGAMFGATGFMDWLTRVALFTGGALPATLAWLLAGCSLKKPLARLPPSGQFAAGITLGVIAGLYACGLLALMGLVRPVPWWGSAFAGALISALLVIALASRARARTPADTAARLTELQARIRPHFLFNTLNSAIALVREEPAKAEAVLEDLSELFRHALVDQGESVTLEQEVQLAERYLAIEQIRFGDRLRIHWAIDEQAGQARLPPLLLQPLVENAVKHGVEPCPEGADIKVSTQRRGDVVVIKVTNTVDTAESRQPGRGHGMALANVRDRLGLLHDVQGSFQFALKKGLFQVRIEVPARS
jgi:two-component system, LytTR family, sensor histidine kinase AlgZ